MQVLERGTPAWSLALPLPARPLGELLSSLILPSLPRLRREGEVNRCFLGGFLEEDFFPRQG